MKLVYLALLMIPTVSFADNVSNKPELARFNVDCIVASRSATRDTVDAEMQGTISVFNQMQSGVLKLGSIGVFNFVADFKFRMNQRDDGIVTFAFQNAEGAVLSQSSVPLPKNGLVETSVDYFDTTSGATAQVRCSVKPVAVFN
jgi:hypothetical protein